MAPTPKKNNSTHRQGRRRAAIALPRATVVKCPQCNSNKEPHVLCPNCGKK